MKPATRFMRCVGRMAILGAWLVAMLCVSEIASAQYSPPPLWVYNGIDGPTSNAFSPDGKYFAIVGYRGVQVFSNTTKALVASYFTQTLGVNTVAFSPDSKTLVVGGQGYSISLFGLIEFWDIATGQMTSELTTEASVDTLAFSPNGKILASGGYDFSGTGIHPTVTLWNVKDETYQGTLGSAAYYVKSLAFSPDSKLLAVGGTGNNGVLEFWNVSSQTLARSLPTQATGVQSVAFSPNGTHVASGGSTLGGTSVLEVWNAPKGNLSTTLAPSGSTVQSLAFSRDGLSLYVGTSNNVTHGGTLDKWNIVSLKRTSILNKNGLELVQGISISPDGNYLLESGQSTPNQSTWSLGVSQIWNLSSSTVTTVINSDLLSYASAFAFSPDSKTLIVGGAKPLPGTLLYSGWIGFWDALKGTLRSGVDCPVSIGAMALSNDGKVLVDAGYTGNDSRIELRNGTTGKLVQTLTSTQSVRFSSVALSPDGSMAAVAGFQTSGSGSFLQLWNLHSKKLMFDRGSSQFTISNDVCFSVDGKELAVAVSTLVNGSKAGFVQVFSTATGQVLQNLYPDQFNIQKLRFAPDGVNLVVCGLQYYGTKNSLNGKSEIWNLSTGSLTATLPDDLFITYFGPVTYSADGKLLYICDSSTIRTFDAVTFGLVSGLNVGGNHGGMAVSPDGQLIAYSGVPEIGVLKSPLASLKLSSSSTSGGSTIKGTVTLNQVAPAGGQIVLLASTSTATVLPSSVYIPKGAATATFTIATAPISHQQMVDISSELGGFSLTSHLELLAPSIVSVTLSPSSVKGGKTVLGTVSINAWAPTGGISIPLSSNSSAATVPAYLVIPQGTSSATFTVTTIAVKSPIKATITAGVGIGSKSAVLAIQ